MAEVDLERGENSLSGALGEQRVDLEFDGLDSRAGIHGTCFGVSVNGYWHIESNYDNLQPVGLFLGDYGGSPIYLRNEVHLTPYYALRYADLSGTVCDQALHARIASVEAPAYGPSVMEIDEVFIGENISVYIAEDANRTRGGPNLAGIHLDGMIGGRPIKLDVTHRSVRGQYDGPDVLFPLFAVTPLYFL